MRVHLDGGTDKLPDTIAGCKTRSAKAVSLSSHMDSVHISSSSDIKEHFDSVFGLSKHHNRSAVVIDIKEMPKTILSTE